MATRSGAAAAPERGDNSIVDLLNEGMRLANRGDMQGARPLVERAYALSPGNKDVRGGLTRIYLSLAAAYFNDSDATRALDVLRRHLALDPPDQHDLQINLMDCLSRSGEKAVLGDFARGLKPDDLGTHILIACMPKSGSSFLYQTMHHLTGYRGASLTFAYMRNEQDLYLPQMLQVARRHTVTQQHCRATQANIALIQAFGIRPVILVRNIHDIVVSLTDYYDQGAIYNSFLSGHWASLPATQRIDAVIDHIVPWYLSFYASWVEACDSGRVEGLFVSYEAMTADKPGTVAAIARFLGMEKSPAECAAAVARADGDRTATRMNKGVTGRGAQRLTDEQKARIARQAGAYLNTDFSPIGAARSVSVRG